MKYCDLHIHSTASDGTYTPTEIAHKAFIKGLSGIAITDHDTTSSIEEGAAACEKYGLDYIPALEISTSDLGGRMHILGYFIDKDNPSLGDLSQRMVESRDNRLTEMCARLTELGYPTKKEDIYRISNGAPIGRPHIAEHLVNIGAVINIWEAFDRFLASGKSAYIPRWAPKPEKAISVIHEAGGLAVAAHPGVTTGMLDKIPELVKLGIDGIEVFYPRHSHENQMRALSYCKKYKLAITGGSDCHGMRRGNPMIGVYKIRYSYMVKLREFWEKKKSASL